MSCLHTEQVFLCGNDGYIQARFMHQIRGACSKLKEFGGKGK